MAKLTTDLEQIGEVAHHGPEDVFIAVMTLFGAFALMLWLHMPLALIAAFIVPVTAFVTTIYGKRMTTTWHELMAGSPISTPASRKMSPASVTLRPPRQGLLRL